MSTYELDDEVVRVFVANYRLRFEADKANATEPMLAEMLGKQIPIPVPAKIGAVVRTIEHEALTRIALDGEANEGPREWRDPAGQRFDTEFIGRIVEVLSEGVDL